MDEKKRQSMANHLKSEKVDNVFATILGDDSTTNREEFKKDNDEDVISLSESVLPKEGTTKEVAKVTRKRFKKVNTSMTGCKNSVAV